MAIDLNIPVRVLSKLKRPLLSDLRNSGVVEQDADLIMFIHRDKDAVDPRTLQHTEIIVGKHRNGPIGTVTLNFM